MSQCKQFLVSGRVQGVFFRASTQDKARVLMLTGWVRNSADGNVELVACGEPQQLQAFEDWLWQGPGSAMVSDVVVQAASDGHFTDFSVRY